METCDANLTAEVSNVTGVNVHIRFDRFASTLVCRVVDQH